MLKISKKENKYEGLSLVEMLVTLVILSVVLLVVAVTLTTMIKASAISSARTLSRNESEFIFEVIKRQIKNADADEIVVYSVKGRELNDSGLVVDVYLGDVKSSFDTPISPDSNNIGNEIHIKPIGSDEWVCIALYPSGSNSESSFLVKGTNSEGGHACLEDTVPVAMNEENIIITNFEIKHYMAASGNVAFVIDLEVTPKHWAPGSQSEFKPEYQRQLIVSTEKITF